MTINDRTTPDILHTEVEAPRLLHAKIRLAVQAALAEHDTTVSDAIDTDLDAAEVLLKADAAMEAERDTARAQLAASQARAEAEDEVCMDDAGQPLVCAECHEPMRVGEGGWTAFPDGVRHAHACEGRYYQRGLAASQARAERLYLAAEKVEVFLAGYACGLPEHGTAHEMVVDSRSMLAAALALPRDRTALDAVLAEARVERLSPILTVLNERGLLRHGMQPWQIERALDEERQHLREACAAIAESEPEPEGPVPADIAFVHRGHVEALVRAGVRATRVNIARRIRETKGEP